ncbi:PREDICTED: transmembrane protein 43 homolog [Rhagoletis zephyria]|uniref:transmembrane protein 43 homolog n=1 Tax=Rhagoletis zephyria TaxID=28612 RepID=UPI00081120E3|nr:PREDICTED: transmembrane protein 43 homolog [Rhagoletis zephyria]
MGWILVFFGVTCTSTLLHIILSHINFLAALAPDPLFPVGANLFLSLSIALIIASIAWILHRPMIGASLLFAAASPFVWCARSVANYQPMN